MPGTWLKRQEKAKPTIVALTCGQLQLLRALKQAQYNVTDIVLRNLHVVTVELRTDCHFVIEYARNTNKTAEGETNLRDSYMCHLSTTTFTGWKSLMWRNKSVRPWLNISDYTVSRILTKFGTGILYRNLSSVNEFLENWCSDIGTVLEGGDVNKCE